MERGGSGAVSDGVADSGGVAVKAGQHRGGFHREGGDKVVGEACVAISAAACVRGGDPGRGTMWDRGGARECVAAAWKLMGGGANREVMSDWLGGLWRHSLVAPRGGT